jgi:AraC-like DNA-binding protein
MQGHIQSSIPPKPRLFRDRSISKSINQLVQAARVCGYDANRIAGMNKITKRQLERIFRGRLSRTPQSWLNEQRMIDASELLKELRSTKRVAWHLGYKQPSHFCREFKKLHGVTASEFVKIYITKRGNYED